MYNKRFFNNTAAMLHLAKNCKYYHNTGYKLLTHFVLVGIIAKILSAIHFKNDLLFVNEISEQFLNCVTTQFWEAI